MSDALRGMVLAAGYGSRLAPLTDRVPKPLFPVDGEALLDRALAACRRAGAPRIGVNAHHLAARIEAHLAARPDAADLSVFPEREILGTGGALHGAREFLAGCDRFFLHNGDVLSDADPAALVAEHRRTGALATLLVVDWPQVNSVRLDAAGAVLGFGAGKADRRLTYTGIAVFESAILDLVPARACSLVEILEAALGRDPGSVRGFAPEPLVWSDVGTLGRFLKAQSGDSAGGALSVTALAGQGSDRRFWRLAAPGWSAVAMLTPDDEPGREEHERFVAAGRFLHDGGLGVAEILAEDARDLAVLMSDLGPHSMLSHLADHPRDALPVTLQAVESILAFQDLTGPARAECPTAVDRSLDREALAWETDYFRERFLAGLLGLEIAADHPLRGECRDLNAFVVEIPQTLIHRDFQSQNLIVGSEGLGIVDHQGLRLGPATYDLASLLWDPYVDLGDAVRAEAMRRYGARGPLAAEEVEPFTLASALQRVMQALGAYGFLGAVKGKREFLRHAPRGVDHLERILVRCEELRGSAPALPPPMPVLRGLIPEIRRHLDRRRLDAPPAAR